MVRLYLVRHGHAAAGYSENADPGLDAPGRAQARAVAQRIAPLGPLAIVSSPLKRARQTANPLAAIWNAPPSIEPAVAEIPSPNSGLVERGEWLRNFMRGSWRSASPDLAQWREELVATLLALPEDTVIFSHFIAINAAVGASVEDGRVVVFHPDNCSVTIVEVDVGRLRLVERGQESETKVN